MSIAEKISLIKREMADAEQLFNRVPGSVQLILATKKRSVLELKQALSAGVNRFGENFLQEALEKIDALKEETIEWHFIGGIQRNKTKKIAENFSWVHSVASLEVATRLNDQRPQQMSPLNICLEVNVSHSQTKSGLNYTEVFKLAECFKNLPRLKLRGLMAIPDLMTDWIDQRAEFYKLRLLFETLNAEGYQLDTLSMGTTEDLKASIAEGATFVRIGRGVFGERSSFL